MLNNNEQVEILNKVREIGEKIFKLREGAPILGGSYQTGTSPEFRLNMQILENVDWFLGLLEKGDLHRPIQLGDLFSILSIENKVTLHQVDTGEEYVPTVGAFLSCEKEYVTKIIDTIGVTLDVTSDIKKARGVK